MQCIINFKHLCRIKERFAMLTGIKIMNSKMARWPAEGQIVVFINKDNARARAFKHTK